MQAILHNAQTSPLVIVVFSAFLVLLTFTHSAVAGFLGRFSLGTGEEYNDNIFFTKDKEQDFVTYIFPTFSLFYAPPGQTAPTFNAEFAPIGQIFARHGGESNFGDNILFRTGYTHQYSPRVTFEAADTFRRFGQTRTGIGDGFLPGSPGSSPGGGVLPPQSAQQLGDFLSIGEQLTNEISFGGRYVHSANINFTGDYTFDYTSFIDQGGRELSHNAAVRGFYVWKQEHNLYLGYTISILKSRNGEDNVVHNFDIGDDYFSSYKIVLAPTLTVLASGGLAVNASSSGPRINSRTSITATKVWEGATLSGGIRKGLTPSLGVAGISATTSFFTDFNIRLTEALTGSTGVEYSLYDTDDVNFKTFQAYAGLEYRITSWLSSNLRYLHRRIDSGSGAASTEFLTRGKVNSNSVLLLFTARFDVWPNVGLARRPLVP